MATQQLEANEQIQGVQDSVAVTAASSDERNAWIQTLTRERKGKVEILVTGKTGTGKSTLVNALVGEKVAEVGRSLKSETSAKVTGYSVKTEEGAEMTVWDSLGLQDGTENEEDYLADVKEKCRGLDLILYCVDSSAKRSELGPGQRDFSGIQKFTDTFGHKLWENAVFVLTRGNTVESNLQDIEVEDIDQAFKERMKEWEGEIRGALKSPDIGLSEEIADNIPVVLAGHANRPNLPGHKLWLSECRSTVADRIRDSSRLDLIVLNKNRVRELSQDTNRREFSRDTNRRAPIGLSRGIGVGAAIGAGVGAAVGSSVPKLGAAGLAAFGAILGGIVGYLVGIGIEMVLGGS